MSVSPQRKVVEIAQTNRAKQRPKQKDGCNQKRAMKKSFEIKIGEKGKQTARGQRLRGPKQDGRKQRAEENGRRKINQQSDCVLQEANVRFPPDAESTHMDGEGWRRAEARGSRDQIRRRLAVSI